MPELTKLNYGRIVRPSIAHNIDKINEVIDWINNSEIKSTYLIESGQGESVQVGNATQLAGLDVFGKSVQDGTPTPENPVPVQVVGGRNQIPIISGKTDTRNNVSSTVNANGSVSLTGTASAEGDLYIFGGWGAYAQALNLIVGNSYTLSIDTPQTGVLAKIYCFNSANAVTGSSTTSGGSVSFTVPANTVKYGISVRVQSGLTVDDTTVYVQLEAGTQATSYIPYGCIGLDINENETPINLQGNTLASLPDGTQDILRVDSTGRVWIEKLVSYIASYDGESVGDIYISTTGQLTTGASVYYKLTDTQTIELGTITPPAIPDNAVISISASLTPEINVSWFTERALPTVVNDLNNRIDGLEVRIEALEGRNGTMGGLTSVSPNPIDKITFEDTIEPIIVDDGKTIETETNESNEEVM